MDDTRRELVRSWSTKAASDLKRQRHWGPRIVTIVICIDEAFGLKRVIILGPLQKDYQYPHLNI